MIEQRLPSWHLELDRFKAFKSTFIIEGNIYDLHSYPTETESGEVRWDLLKLDRYLYNYLLDKGYETVVFYNPVDGFNNEFNIDHLNDLLEIASYKLNEKLNHSLKPSLENASKIIRNAMSSSQQPIAIVMNLASRFISSPTNLNGEEREFYTRILLSTLKPKQVKTKNGNLVNHLLFIIPNKVNDIPAWFYLENPYVKTLNIHKPDKYTRKRFIESQIRFFVNSGTYTSQEMEKHQEKFVDLTDGLTNIELNGLKVLCRQENIPIHKIQEAISLYKYGIKQNPWNELSHTKLANAENFIKERVKGQEAAISHTLDIIKRAASGMSGLQHSLNSSKPKGILFFAGPTGTGKTELAKSLASLLFGDESACVRFDMSEYQQSHSDQKLLGAPPGYVGYQAGGQLTNAIKERPFSILLFDEIEKAHPSILDKFLQILEDGRMTDGKGETVYFSESIIIFTSNLGIFSKDEYGKRIPNASPTFSYDENKENILKAIKDYFVLELGRPEILNRFGDNFVVFDYIRDEVANLIIDGQLKKIKQSLQDHKGITLSYSDETRAFLLEKSMKNLENGGRGIGNIIEKYFLNPFSRYYFDKNIQGDCCLDVLQILEEENYISVECKVNNV